MEFRKKFKAIKLMITGFIFALTSHPTPAFAKILKLTSDGKLFAVAVFQSDETLVENLESLREMSIIRVSLATNGYNITSDFIALSEDAELNSNGSRIESEILLQKANSELNLRNGSVMNGTIHDFSHIDSVVTIDSTSSLLLNSSTLESSINGLNSGEGSLTINADQTVTAEVAIGSSSSLATLTLESGSSLVVGEYDVAATNIIIAENAAASFAGDISGDIEFNGSLALAKTTATSGYEDFAGNVILGDIIGSGTLDLGLGTHYVDGNLTLKSGSTLAVEAVSASELSRITASGIASIDSSTKLHLSLNGITLNSGSSYKVVSSETAPITSNISNENITINNSISNIHDGKKYTTSVVGNDLFVDVVDEDSTPPDDSISSGGRYSHITGASNPSGNLLAVKNLIESGASESVIEKAVSEIKPQADNAVNTVPIRSSDNILNLAVTRLSALRGFSSGNGVVKHSVWGQTFGAKVNQGNSANVQGYRSATHGVTFGIDKEVSQDMVLGVNVSYSNSRIDSKDRVKRTDLDSYQINLYGSREFDKFFLNILAGAAFNEYHSNRAISLVNANAGAKYNGQTIIGKAEIGKTYDFKNNLVLTPTLAVTAAKNRVGNYVESGAGTLNLQVQNKDTSFFETRFGLKIGREFRVCRTQKIHPTFYTSYGYDFARSKQRASSRFVGQSAEFASSGGTVAQGSLKVGSSFRLFYLDSFSLDADYNFEHRVNYAAHSGSLKAKMEF